MINNQYPYPAPNLVGRVVGDEAILVLPGQGQVKVLNEVGARIWSLADGSRTVGQIAQEIRQEFEVEEAQADADVQYFVDVLVQKGILLLSEMPRQLR